eukprot:555979-Rhodomonas_salina.1
MDACHLYSIRMDHQCYIICCVLTNVQVVTVVGSRCCPCLIIVKPPRIVTVSDHHDCDPLAAAASLIRACGLSNTGAT